LCQFFSFDTTPTTGVCALYYNGACTKSDSAVANTNLYAKTGFHEDPFFTDGVCTHYQAWDEDPHKAAYCKKHSTKEMCHNINQYGLMQGRYIKLATGDDCTGSDNSANILFDDTTDVTLEACTTKCFLAYGHDFIYGTDASTQGNCKCFKTACTAGGANANYDLYVVENPCYWTTSTLVHS
jgi:hypothetical protein